MEGIRPNDYDAFKFAISTILRFYPRATCFRQGAEITHRGGWQPFFGDFTNPSDAPTAETQNLISMIFEIRQASIKADFQNKLDKALIRRVGNERNEEYLTGKTVYIMAANRKVKKKENGYVRE